MSARGVGKRQTDRQIHTLTQDNYRNHPAHALQGLIMIDLSNNMQLSLFQPSLPVSTPDFEGGIESDEVSGDET